MNCTDETVVFRLKALSCPFIHSSQDYNNVKSDALQIQKLIVWLEDTHIRRLPIPQRKILSSSTTKTIASSLRHYLRLLNKSSHDVNVHLTKPPALPQDNQVQSFVPCLLWLIDLALHLAYTDDSIKYNEPIDPWNGLYIPPSSSPPHAQNNPQIIDATKNLLTQLNVNEDDCVRFMNGADDGLNVAADIIKYSNIIQYTEGINNDHTSVLVMPRLHQIPLGFTTNDETVDKLGKIMRLLHIKQLRNLQDDINLVNTDMQKLTSNPKTNSKLGKVGR